MAVQYLLPCECGNSTPVDVSQAGGSVVCGCGKKLEVPSLRAIRKLPPRTDSVPTRSRQWNPAAGMIFAIGVLIALGGALLAGYMHMKATRAADFAIPPDEQIAAWVAEVDQAPPEKLLELWNASRHMGLGDHHDSPYVRQRMEAQRFAMFRNTGLIVLASGVVFAGVAVWLGRKPA